MQLVFHNPVRILIASIQNVHVTGVSQIISFKNEDKQRQIKGVSFLGFPSALISTNVLGICFKRCKN